MEVVRIGMAKVISAASQFVVCAATGDYDEVEDLVERHRPHLMVAEAFHGNHDGITWIKGFVATFPQTKVLIATSSSEATYAERALRAGAFGYWMKTGSVDELLHAIETVLSGELHVSPRVALLALHKLANRPAEGVGKVTMLSDRELHVFTLIGTGHGVGQIARALGISRKTVETHCEHIKVKLDFGNAGALKRGARHLLSVV